jgi:hypothetical protein
VGAKVEAMLLLDFCCQVNLLDMSALKMHRPKAQLLPGGR